MIVRCSGEKFSPRGMYIRSSYISPDWNDMRSIADINELCAMLLGSKGGIKDVKI